jgi:predicted cupin superfamily sugar epimerase
VAMAAGAFALPLTSHADATKVSVDPAVLVAKLGLIPHPEGGFFRETYRSGSEPMKSMGGTDTSGTLMDTDRVPKERNLMTSIYWLLNQDSPNGWWCR